MSERDKYLTEAMGFAYSFCSQQNYENGFDCSTWEGFGKLWNWSQKQVWWAHFLFILNYEADNYYQIIPAYVIHPDMFADAVYNYLKEREV